MVRHKKKRKLNPVLKVLIIITIGAVLMVAALFVIKKAAVSQKQHFSNSGHKYTVVLDSYVKFDNTTQSSNVNNEDGLQLSNGDSYIIMQRFPVNESVKDWTLEQFEAYIRKDEQQASNNHIESADFTLKNSKITESSVQQIDNTTEGKKYFGYLYYFKTQDAFYKVLLTGSDSKLVEHYKYFLNGVQFS